MVYSRHAHAHKSVHKHGSHRKHAVHRASPGSGGGAIQNHQYDGLIARAANRYGVDPALVKAIICKESRFNPRAQSEAGARGLMQMMPDTARGLGVKDPFNPEQNVTAGTRYIGQLLKRYRGNERLALAAYNAGPGNVAKYGGVPPFAETQNYVTKVNQFRHQYAAERLSQLEPGSTSPSYAKVASASNFQNVLTSLAQGSVSPSASLPLELDYRSAGLSNPQAAFHNALAQHDMMLLLG